MIDFYEISIDRKGFSMCRIDLKISPTDKTTDTFCDFEVRFGWVFRSEQLYRFSRRKFSADRILNSIFFFPSLDTIVGRLFESARTQTDQCEFVSRLRNSRLHMKVKISARPIQRRLRRGVNYVQREGNIVMAIHTLLASGFCLLGSIV